MTEEIKCGRLARDLSATKIEVRRAEDSKRVTLTFPASSEAPVERWFGTEVLSHEPQAIRMDRLQSGAAPLLFNHDWSDPVGMIDGARIEGGRLMVDATMFSTARATEVATMVEQGLRNVSVGYEIEELTEDSKRGVFRATRWLPLEVSVVTIPADASVGLGRTSDETQLKAVRMVRAENIPQPAAAAAPSEGVSVSDTNTTPTAAAATTAAPVHAMPAQVRQGPSAMDIEKSRVRGIENLCKANKIDNNIRDHWVGTGLAIEDITDDLLKIIEERGKNNATAAPSHLGLSDKETKRFSLFRAIQATDQKNWTNAGFELECTREIAKKLGRNNVDPNRFFVPMEVQQRQFDYAPGASFGVGSYGASMRAVMQRDLTAGAPTAGGHLVGTRNMSFIEVLRNRTASIRLGATVMPGLVESVTMPRQTGAATAVWMANEASTITESQQVFSQLALSPKTVGAYTEVSRQLMLQSSPAAEGIVTSDLASVCAIAYDLAVISGSGASGQPTGITATAGIGAVTGTSLGVAGILEFQTDVANANVVPVSGGFLTTPAVAALLMQRVKFSGTASPLWEGNVWDGSVYGFPAMTSLQAATATALFGDWSQVVIGEWGTLEIEVNPYANFQSGITGIRAMVSMDCGLRYAGAFSLATVIT